MKILFNRPLLEKKEISAIIRAVRSKRIGGDGPIGRRLESLMRKIFKEAVYKFIKDHPYRFIFLFFKKLYYFWWFSPVTGIRYSYLYLISYKIWYFIVLFFAISGIIFTLSLRDYRIKNKAYLLLLFFLAISIIQSLFYVEGRHRWAIEPLLLIFTANGIIYITDRIRKCLKARI